MHLDIIGQEGAAVDDVLPLRLRRGDTRALEATDFRDDDQTGETWAAGDVLVFTLALHPSLSAIEGPCPATSCRVLQVAGTFVVGDDSATFTITPADWPSWVERASFPADVQLTRADGSVMTLWYGRVVVEPDVS